MNSPISKNFVPYSWSDEASTYVSTDSEKSSVSPFEDLKEGVENAVNEAQNDYIPKQSPSRCLEILAAFSSSSDESTECKEKSSSPDKYFEIKRVAEESLKSSNSKSDSYSNLGESSKSKSESCSHLEESSKTLSESISDLENLQKNRSKRNNSSPQRIKITNEKPDLSLHQLFPNIKVTDCESTGKNEADRKSPRTGSPRVIKHPEGSHKKSKNLAPKLLQAEDALTPDKRTKKLSYRSFSATSESSTKIPNANALLVLNVDEQKALRASDSDIDSVSAKRKAFSLTRGRSIDTFKKLPSPLASLHSTNNTNSRIINTNSNVTTTNASAVNKHAPSFRDYILTDRTGSKISLKLDDEEKSARFDNLNRLEKKSAISEHDKDFISYWKEKRTKRVNFDDIEIKQGALHPECSLYKAWHECFDLLINYAIEKNAKTLFTETLHQALKTFTVLSSVGFGKDSFKGVSVENILSCFTDIYSKDYKSLKVKEKDEIQKIHKKINIILNEIFVDDELRTKIFELLNNWKKSGLPNALKDSGKTLQNITCFEHLWHEPVVHDSKKLPPTIDEMSYNRMIKYYLAGDKLLPIKISINGMVLFEKPEGGEMTTTKEKDFLFKILSGMYKAFGYELDEKSLIDQIATLEFRKKCDPTKFTPQTLTCFRLLKLGASWKRALHYWMLRAGNAENHPLNMEVQENISLDFHCDGKSLSNSYVEQIKTLKLCNKKELEADHQIKAIIPVSWKVHLPDEDVKVPMWHFCLRPLHIGLSEEVSRQSTEAVLKYMSNFKDTPVGENDLVIGGIEMKSIFNNSLSLEILRNEILPTTSEKSISVKREKSFIFPAGGST